MGLGLTRDPREGKLSEKRKKLVIGESEGFSGWGQVYDSITR